MQVDRWLIGVLAISLVAMAAVPIAVALDPTARGDFWWVALMTVGIWALVVVLTLPTRYELTLDELRVRSGLLRTSLRWADVVRVELTFSPVSSTTAAWTFRRVSLATQRGRVLEVGPRDRLGFVAEVLARVPHLVEEAGAGKARAWHDPARDRRRRRA
ncbi:MAG: PH domain-containing protein [Trueperaceae bacterium]